MRALFCCLVAATLWLAAPLPVSAEEPQSSSPFSDAQREVLHAEIRAYLLEHPEVLQEMITLLEQKQQAATAENDLNLVAMHADEIFDDGFSWVGGNPEGAFTVVEFLDYQCGFCKRAQPDVTELLKSDGDIRLIVKEMPILGPGSELAARAAVATMVTEGPEKYAALHAELMGLQGGITDVSLDQALSDTGLDPGQGAGGDAGSRGGPPPGRHPRPGGEARHIRHPDLRLRQPDDPRLPAAGADARSGGNGARHQLIRGADPRSGKVISAFPPRAAPNIQGPDPERGQAGTSASNKNRAHMSKRPQESDIEFIKALAELLRANDLTEIEVNRDYGEEEALTVRVARQAPAMVAPMAPAPLQIAAPAAAAAAAPAAADPGEDPGVVPSPMVGTAYLSPEPEAPAFVKVGDPVTEGQTILIIEAMKTMNQIAAPRAGRIKRLLVADGQPVEFGAPLFILE